MGHMELRRVFAGSAAAAAVGSVAVAAVAVAKGSALELRATGCAHQR